MEQFDIHTLTKLYIPSAGSHKGQNGKVLIIGGSHLFHAAALWALSISSKIVDMVFFASVPENNEIVLSEKKLFHNGIVIPRKNIADYIEEADCILIGPGLERNVEFKMQNSELKFKVEDFKDIEQLDSGGQTYWLTKLLIEKYPEKKFVFDGGSLQMMDPKWLSQLKQTPILTPHKREFDKLFSPVILEETKSTIGSQDSIASLQNDNVRKMAKKYEIVINVKGETDLVCSKEACIEVPGGNAGMTKGGTGDVLAGLTASLYAQNSDPLLVATAASFFNKKAGEALFEKVGYYFNSSDLVEEIPKVMRKYLL